MSKRASNYEHLVIAPKGSRRAGFWKDVLGQSQLYCKHISYQSIILDDFVLDGNVQYIVRLESPGECFETYQAIIHFGNDELYDSSLKENFGELADFGPWYTGWCKLLDKIKQLQKCYQWEFINDPLDISKTFNKKGTQELLVKSRINCPEILESNCYDLLTVEMKTKNIPQVFIKPICGSSASGIIAFRYSNKEKQVAYTTIKKEGPKFYNSLKVQRYTSHSEIREVFNTISKDDVHIERWIPKCRFDGLNIDFRVVVINQKVEFIVPRGSKSPITNLHLGNQKLQLSDLNLSEEIIDRIKETALETMRCFPGLLYAGIDILLSSTGKVYVLEVNPFGDLLLDIVNENNNNTYEQELACL